MLPNTSRNEHWFERFSELSRNSIRSSLRRIGAPEDSEGVTMNRAPYLLGASHAQALCVSGEPGFAFDP